MEPMRFTPQLKNDRINSTNMNLILDPEEKIELRLENIDNNTTDSPHKVLSTINCEETRSINRISTKSALQTRKKKSSSFNIFPLSFGLIENYVKVLVYLKVAESGRVEGLTFENIDDRVVISHIADNFINTKGLKVNDVILSVNNIDARYSTYQRIMSAMCGKREESKTSNTSRVYANSVNDTIICIVFARSMCQDMQ